MFDFDAPFYRPLWLRIALTAFMIGWGVLELVVGSPFWGTIFLVGGVYLGYRLFVTFDPGDSKDESEEEGKED